MTLTPDYGKEGIFMTHIRSKNYGVVHRKIRRIVKHRRISVRKTVRHVIKKR